MRVVLLVFVSLFTSLAYADGDDTAKSNQNSPEQSSTGNVAGAVTLIDDKCYPTAGQDNTSEAMMKYDCGHSVVFNVECLAKIYKRIKDQIHIVGSPDLGVSNVIKALTTAQRGDVRTRAVAMSKTLDAILASKAIILGRRALTDDPCVVDFLAGREKMRHAFQRAVENPEVIGALSFDGRRVGENSLGTTAFAVGFNRSGVDLAAQETGGSHTSFAASARVDLSFSRRAYLDSVGKRQRKAQQLAYTLAADPLADVSTNPLATELENESRAYSDSMRRFKIGLLQTYRHFTQIADMHITTLAVSQLFGAGRRGIMLQAAFEQKTINFFNGPICQTTGAGFAVAWQDEMPYVDPATHCARVWKWRIGLYYRPVEKFGVPSRYGVVGRFRPGPDRSWNASEVSVNVGTNSRDGAVIALAFGVSFKM